MILRDTFLMCAPQYFEVAYNINPWMKERIAHSENSMKQWQALVDAIGKFAHIELMQARPGVPDLVFTANAGVVLNNKVIVSRFLHSERQAEEPYFKEAFENHGFQILPWPESLPFEGAGDALLDRNEDLMWFGYGHRSDMRCTEKLAELLEITVQPLKLVNPHFYHLDTCFCPLSGGFLMYFPMAFDAASCAAIEKRVPADKRIMIDESNALDFACNAVNSGENIFLNRASKKLESQLNSHGFVVHQTPLNEFLKSGGAAKCLTLKLNETQKTAISQYQAA